MAEISETLKAISVRNQVLLERLKQGEHEKFAPFLKRLEKVVRDRLSSEGETIFSKTRLNTLLVDVRLLQKDIYDDYLQQLTLDLNEIALSQAGTEAKSYNKVVANFEATIPSAAQVSVALRVNPLQIEGYTGNPLLEPFIKDWSTSKIQQVNNVIQQGYYQGATVSEMTASLRGTKTNNYNDGEWAKVNRSNRQIVRTSIQHSATQARQVTMDENSDLVAGYQWVSTLDSRTSSICSGLDGRQFEVGNGPLPPLHISCRSSTSPTLSSKYDFLKVGAKRASKGESGGKQVSAKETYYSWLKAQPKAFQAEAIGPMKAKLLRDGGLTAEQFAKQSLNRNFEPLSLKEWKRKSPSLFDEAGL